MYIVQAGDTLSYIASRFNVTLDELMTANPAVDPNVLSRGQEIVIPGLEGVTGVLETEDHFLWRFPAQSEPAHTGL